MKTNIRGCGVVAWNWLTIGCGTYTAATHLELCGAGIGELYWPPMTSTGHGRNRRTTMTITKQNYVLVDFENVQAMELERIKSLPVKVVLFAGRNQKYVPMDLLRKACMSPGCVEVVESVGSGKNALDFQMACYAGRIAEREPKAFIHFVSKDKGFDVVVRFLKSAKRMSARVDAFASLFFLAQKVQLKSYSLEQKVEHVLARLARLSATTRPRKRRTLQSSMNSMFGKELDASMIKEVMDKLISDGCVIPGTNGSVMYRLPSG